jgi:hypothetical protein
LWEEFQLPHRGRDGATHQVGDLFLHDEETVVEETYQDEGDICKVVSNNRQTAPDLLSTPMQMMSLHGQAAAFVFIV